MKAKCPDCDTEFEIDNDYKVGEITSCPCCGLELEVKGITISVVDNVNGKVKIIQCMVQELTLEGEDWGE